MGFVSKFKKRYLLLLVVLLLPISIYTCVKVIHLPFPFIEMSYLSKDEFYKTPVFKNENTQTFDSLYLEIKNSVKLTRDIVFVGKGNQVRDKTNILEVDNKFTKICSEASKILHHVLKSKDIISRVVWMNGHTVTEVFTPSTDWFLVDSYGDIVIKNCNGKFLNLKEIKYTDCLDVIDLTNDSNSRVNYKHTDYINSPNNAFKKQDLYVVINDDYLYDYHYKTKKLKNIIPFVFTSKNNIGEGIQLVKENTKRSGNFGIKAFLK